MNPYQQYAAGFILGYFIVILAVVLFRTILGFLIAERGFWIAYNKGYDREEVKINRLALFLTIIFGVVISYLIVLLYVHALPMKPEQYEE